MPDVWMPGLIKDPGRSAGYNGGETSMTQWIKHHDTAGTDSYNVCKWGRPGYNVSLCQILIPKVGVPWQFCEINAICADSGDWNGWGPGIEVERLGASQTENGEKEPLTSDQIHWLAEINLWLQSEWGMPNVMYDGPKFGATGFQGHVSHFDIAFNPDGLTVSEWIIVTATGGSDVVKPPQKKRKETHMLVVGNQIEAGRPDAGRVLTVLYDTQSGVECGRTVEDAGAFGFGPVGSSWISQGAVAYLTSPLAAYAIGTRMWAMAQQNGVVA